MKVDIPEDVLQKLYDIVPEFQYEPNGPDLMVCPVCNASGAIRYGYGDHKTVYEPFGHDSDCAAEWARSVLNTPEYKNEN